MELDIVRLIRLYISIIVKSSFDYIDMHSMEWREYVQKTFGPIMCTMGGDRKV